MYKFILIIVTAAFFFSGCSMQNADTSYTPPALGEEWSVKMTVSGGIAGLLRIIEVQADGSYTVIDERAGTTLQGNLDEEQVTALKELIENLVFVAPSSPTGCADCFVYDVEIESGAKKMIIHADDLTLGESGMGELVHFLQGLINTALG
ncbi:MAG: hypothetical protein HXY38_04130 [Chloroflexi bacterium]|nr:hypothetical protein [Chloroflexota bacterium]